MAAQKRGDYSMVGKITSANLWRLVSRNDRRSEKQPYLFDHVPDESTPWLPGVMATEALAEGGDHSGAGLSCCRC